MWCMAVCGVWLCMVYGCVWCRAVCGVGLCVVYGCVWCMAVYGVWLCVVYGCVWCMAVYGVGLCVVYGCVWCRAVCGVGLCVVGLCSVGLGCNKICAHYSNTMILFGCATNDYSVLILAYLVISYFNSSMNYRACISSIVFASKIACSNC